jgi:ParB family chromosome partitioning protein
MARKALGKGLGALLTTPEPSVLDGVVEISMEEIQPGAHQPRRKFNEKSLHELAASIREQGLLQPVVVRPLLDGGYELVAGERRWRAARLASLQAIPAVVREVDDRQATELSLVENIQREDLNAIEQAEAYRRLMDEFGLSQEDVAARTGKDRATISNFLRLLNLPKIIQEEVMEGRLTAGHARALLALSSQKAQLDLCKKIKAKGLSVRQTETLARQPERKIPSPRPKDIFLSEAEGALRRRLGTKVRIQGSTKRGKIEINYFTGEELEGLLSLLTE